MAVTYADLDSAPAVLLVGFEPEEESPIVYLRLRKAARKKALPVMSIAPFATRGLTKMAGRLIECAPGAEAAALDNLADDAQLKLPGALILVGERLAGSPGALSAASRLAAATGARLAWVPRRAGERGAVEAGALPGLLPGGRPLADASAREQTAAAWNVDELPDADGRDTTAILAAARDGELGALLIGGVELADLPDPDAALAAIDAAPFVVSLELRESAVTDLADVVFPVAPVVEKAGSFVNWEGRIRPFEPALQTNAIAGPAGACTSWPTRSASTSPCRTRWPPATKWLASGCGAATRPERSAGLAGAAVTARRRSGGAGELADAAGRGAAAGRRTLSRRNGPPARRAAVSGHRRRDRRCRRRSGHGQHRSG